MAFNNNNNNNDYKVILMPLDIIRIILYNRFFYFIDPTENEKHRRIRHLVQILYRLNQQFVAISQFFG